VVTCKIKCCKTFSATLAKHVLLLHYVLKIVRDYVKSEPLQKCLLDVYYDLSYTQVSDAKKSCAIFLENILF